MPRPLAHIGYHKTATTWFQQVFYPAVRNRPYVPRERVYDALVRPGAFAFDPRAAKLRLGGGDAPILCEEELSGYLHNGGLSGYGSQAMAMRLSQTLPGADIVIFVRAQSAMASASYLQYVRVGGTHGPRRYLLPASQLAGAAADPFKAPRFSIDHLAYDQLAGFYAALFGPARVHLFTYEEFAADQEGFARRFAERFGLDVDWSRVSYAKRNVSYGRTALAVARTLNRFTRRAVIDKHHFFHVPGLYTARRHALEPLSKLPGKPLTPDQVLGWRLEREVSERFRESNSRLARDFDLDLRSWGYPLTKSDMESPGETRAAV